MKKENDEKTDKNQSKKTEASTQQQGTDEQKKEDGHAESDSNFYEADRGFHKIFLPKFINAIGPVGSKQTQVVLWILRHLSSNNELNYSYRQIAKEADVSYQTVVRTMKILQEQDFLRWNKKVLMVNPDIVFKGRHKVRALVQEKYEGIKTQDEQYLSHLRKQINRLTSEANRIDELFKAEKILHDAERDKVFSARQLKDSEERIKEIENELNSPDAEKDKLTKEKEYHESLKKQIEEMQEKKEKKAAANRLTEEEREQERAELQQIRHDMRLLRYRRKKIKEKLKKATAQKRADEKAKKNQDTSETPDSTASAPIETNLTDAESQRKEDADAPVSENGQVSENEQITENKQDAEDTQAPENA